MYSGDSIGKAYARAWAYKQIPFKLLQEGKHIVLASRDCGDIKFLLNYGVDKENIIAFDTDKEACLSAEELGIKTYNKSIEELQTVGPFKNIASINIDLTCTIKPALKIVKQVLQRTFIPKYTQVFLTFMYGRKDGFTNEYERAFYYWKEIGFRDYDEASVKYTSTSLRTKGSPMITIQVSH